ncbi:MAG TPA: hypothetical protein H9681_07610 [Firmicutes bacterium]|nr:hypothetical protein [Bacillota bacterium]
MSRIVVGLIFCLVFSLVSCTETLNETPTTITIDSSDDWNDFVERYNSGEYTVSDRNDNADSGTVGITVEFAPELELVADCSLGTPEIPFRGELRFNGSRVVFAKNLVAYADDVSISDLCVYSNGERRVLGSIVASCTGRAEFTNIRLNSSTSEDGTSIVPSPETLFFDSPILLGTGGDVRLDDIRIFNAVVSSYESAAGLIGSCDSLDAARLNIGSFAVQSLYGQLTTDSSLIVRTVGSLNLTDCEISRASVTALTYSSACALECASATVDNVKYRDCNISTFPTLTTPGSAAGIAVRGLNEFTESGLTAENVNLNADITGVITADPQSKYYN